MTVRTIMRTEDILQLAQPAYCSTEFERGGVHECYEFSKDELIVFAESVAAAEREACCLPDVTNAAEILGNDTPHVVVEKYRAAIRARGAT